MIRKSERDRSALPQIKNGRPQGSPIQSSRQRENELLKRQHQKIEAQLKKYNDILNNQKIKKDHNLKKKIEVLLNNAGNKNSQSTDPKNKNDFMKIYGVGLSSPKPKQIEGLKVGGIDGISKLPQLKIGKKK